MRLIDADKMFQKVWNGSDDVYTVNDVLELIDEQPTVAASQWHRVEVELPDLLQFVLVCNDEGKCVVAQYVGYQTDSLTPWRIAYTMYDTDIYDENECGRCATGCPLSRRRRTHENRNYP